MPCPRLVSGPLKSYFPYILIETGPTMPILLRVLLRVLLGVLYFFLLVILLNPEVYGQGRPSPIFKNGLLTPANSLLRYKISHPLWQSARFGSGYYVVVQLDRVANSGQKADLASRGIRLEQYISGNSYLAICSEGSGLQNPGRVGIKNIYAIPPELKVRAGLRNDWAGLQGGPLDFIAVTCFPGDQNQIEKSLREAGARITETKIKPANTWFVKCSLETVEKLSLLPFVSSISPIHLEDVPLNYNNHAIHGVSSLSTPVGRNLSGKNLTIGIGDNADPSAHIDLAGKLILRTDEPVDLHGTHTSGTIAGGGIANPLFTGMAPRSHLVVNDFSNIMVNSPVYVADYDMPLTSNSYFNGASNCPGDGDYNPLSYYVDAQMLAFPKLLHVFAAGNDGFITCSPLPPSFGTIKSGFQTAKNILTIGSMNNVVYTIGAGSSRGPTADGRIKPELVAGGVVITSTIPGNLYSGMTGTSMACPTATGILALITERWRQLHGGDFPDGALLKTLVLNSAVDLGNPGPDFTYGFGMISARTTVEALEQNHYFTGTVSGGGSQSFTIPSLPSGAYQLKVLLYWPDAPAQPFAATTLVNDLDLTVTEPGGTVHLPMVLDPTAGNLNNNAIEGVDHTNNVEQVVVNNPPAGDFTLNVTGSSLPAGAQPFNIAYQVIQPSVTVEYPFGGETWVPGQTENIRWSAYGGDPNPFTLEYSMDGGGSWTVINNAIPSTSRSYAWLVPALVTNNALIRITRNSAGYSDRSDYPFTILGQPILTVTNPCPGYAQLMWNKVNGGDTYDIMKLSGDTMQLIANTTDTSFLVTPLNPNNSYWFSVRAIHNSVPGRRSIGQQIIPNGGACSAAVLNNDLFTDSVLSPVGGRQFTSSQPGIQRISIRVRNPGSLPTSSPLSYTYQVNGGTPVTETDPAVIPAGSSTVFTFLPGKQL